MTTKPLGPQQRSSTQSAYSNIVYTVHGVEASAKFQLILSLGWIFLSWHYYNESDNGSPCEELNSWSSKDCNEVSTIQGKGIFDNATQDQEDSD